MIFLDACVRKPTRRPPVWVLLQSSSYLPGFKKLYDAHSFMHLSTDPALATQAALLPVEVLNVDATMVFSDVLLPLKTLGFELDYPRDSPPMVANPMGDHADLDRLKQPQLARDMGFLAEVTQRTRAELPPDVALIGAVGAPFTLACYAVEGRPTKESNQTRQFMFEHPDTFDALIEVLCQLTIDLIGLQVAHGVDAIQIFDTKCGCLSAFDYQRVILPRIRKIMSATKDLGVPRILYVQNAAHLRWFLSSTGAEVMGLDWTMPIAHSRRLLGDHVAIQGNLDPSVLFADADYIQARTRAMLEANGSRPGHIANLGSGVQLRTSLESVQLFVQTVRNFRY